MKNNTKISIIIPIYNADKYLKECLESILNQSLREIELICVNDNSQDNSTKILKQYADKDKRIKVLTNKITQGQSYSRNVGISMAKGEYIGFVDADDFVEKTMFAKMLQSAQSQNADMVMCKASVYDEKTHKYNEKDGYYSLACFDEKFNQKVFNHHDTTSFWEKINVAVWNKIFKKEFLINSGAKFPEHYIYEDLPYFYETYTKAKRVTLVNEFLYVYRQNSQNSTMTKRDKNVKDRVDMVAMTYEILQKQTYFKKFKANIIDWLIHDLFYRCLVIDSRYQKEYFFRMQKFFRTLDTSDVDETLIKSPYYPHFCEIKKRNYDESIKYFFNQETLGSAYVERAKEIFEKEYKSLGVKQQQIQKLEEENLQKKFDLEKLQDKILQDEKERWFEFEKKSGQKKSELQKAENDFYDKCEQRQNDLNTAQKEIDDAWAKFKSDTQKRNSELEKLQDKILQDEKDRWQDFNAKTENKTLELQKTEEEFYKQNEKRQKELESSQLELDKAWEQFKNDTQKRKEELDKFQDKILQDEKDRWQDFNAKTENKTLELQKAEEEFYKQNEKRQKELESSQLELDKAWEQFKNDTQKRKEELDKLQDKILQTEKELWAEYQNRSKELENSAERQRNRAKLALSKTKNFLHNKYLEDVAKEKTNLVKDMKNEIEKEQEYYSDMLKKQLELQQKNYEKINSFKKKIEETEMNRPKVSIVLPVYNVEPYLRQALDSVVGQTLTDIEIICVDDGSTDESGKILDEYKEKDDRIKVIHKNNAGTGAARNDGLKIATGECIGFVDPDDWILPNMYERLYSILQEKELDIVMFTPDVYNDKTKKHEGFLYFQNSNFPDFLDNKIFNKDDISPFSYPMCVWNKLYRKKLFDDNNIEFAEGLDFEDHKVIFKSLFTAKRIFFIREKLYVYRHTREGSILSDNDTRMFDHIKIYDIVENILKETGNWEKFHLDFLRYKVHNILYYYTMIKPQYKKDYYDKMVKSLHSTKMSEEEIETLSKDYPDLKVIMERTFSNKIKKVVKKIMHKDN